MEDRNKAFADKLSACVSMPGSACAEMPKYKCIKEVWALKIKSIVFNFDGTATFTPEDIRYSPIRLDAEYVQKHKPIESGYYVIYKDGYKSFSPASAFEDGYVLVECDFKSRLIIEQFELEEKLKKLSSFLDQKGNIDSFQRDLMTIQFSAMHSYNECLKARLERL